ncbi:hypothetical protein ACEQ8H_001957 [Pleosporales sp. CAS-2024a]
MPASIPTSVPTEQLQSKPSFAKVAASAMTSRPTPETVHKARPPVAMPRNLPLSQNPRHVANDTNGVKAGGPHRSGREVGICAVPTPSSGPDIANGSANNSNVDSAISRGSNNLKPEHGSVTNTKVIPADGRVSNTVVRTREWTDAAIQSAAPSSDLKGEVQNGTGNAIQQDAPAKVMAAEDSSTQVSSSDDSGKPASIDGKSIASTNTFALDEKESLRPDDSASLRAVEEEDVTSPPESVVAESRHGSDHGANRAFHDQLREIAVMNAHRGGPPGRFPNLQMGAHTPYDPVQIANGARPSSQPIGNIATRMNDESNWPPVPDDKLLEAARSPRDRLYIVKIEGDLSDFIKNPSETELDLPSTNAFYRMIAHKLADYFLLGHQSDDTKTGVKITRTPYCRIPPLISKMIEPKDSGIAQMEMPIRKIMRREDGKSGTNTGSNSQNASKATSEAGSNDGKDKDKEKPMTREEREANYANKRRQIFGDSENEDNQKSESGDGTGSPEEKDKEAPRSNSAVGKKKNRKPRNYDDDEFHTRSSFNAYYPPSQQPTDSLYAAPGSVYYSATSGQMPPYSSIHPGLYSSSGQGLYSNMTSGPTPPSSNLYQPMPLPHQQAPYGWPGAQYQPPSGPNPYTNHASMPSGHDMSSQFSRSTLSFKSIGLPSQVTPTMGNVPMASYDAYPLQQQPTAGALGWNQMPPQHQQPQQQPSYPTAGSFQQNGNRPMPAAHQGLPQGAYPYGQFSTSAFNSRPNHNQHPIPGSYNRQFNPQSQAFIPGGPHTPYSQSLQSGQGQQAYGGTFHNVAGNNHHSGTGPVHYGGFHSTTTPPFGSPQSASNFSPGMQRNPSQPGEGKVNSISKYGTPSNLPQKPPAPAPAAQQGPKFF